MATYGASAMQRRLHKNFKSDWLQSPTEHGQELEECEIPSKGK
jgi:hypothetical protein